MKNNSLICLSNQSNAVIKLHRKIYKENNTFYNGVTSHESLNAAFDDNGIKVFKTLICSKEHLIQQLYKVSYTIFVSEGIITLLIKDIQEFS